MVVVDWAKGSDTKWRRFRATILRRDRYRCRIGLPGCVVTATHVDHIIPLHQGGAKYDPANCRAACADCNLSRGRGRERRDPEPQPRSSW